MKNFIKILLPIIVVIIVSYSGYRTIKIAQDKKMHKKEITHIPTLELKTLQGDHFTNKDIRQDIPVIFLYFNSECDLCRTETEEIVTNMEKLNDIQIIFISNESIQQAIVYQQKYKLDNFCIIPANVDDRNLSVRRNDTVIFRS
jgi:cytochrome oxidase Cu insertion factor (SCO1/SenC/PrrC family)